jgi:isoquinoline 1-oxidoreductase alpha subunit
LICFDAVSPFLSRFFKYKEIYNYFKTSKSITCNYDDIKSIQMTKIQIQVNGQLLTVEADPEMPLLWALRDLLGMTGTKFGCGMTLCGACTVHLDGAPVRSCSLSIGQIKKGKITTIEGLSDDNSHPVQQAWIETQAPQCGYCQSGQIMSAVALLKNNPQPTDADIDGALAGNLCRCGTYPRIRAAVKRAAELMKTKSAPIAPTKLPKTDTGSR